MRIGIDIDEVLADFMPVLLNYHNEYYNTFLKMSDILSYNLEEAFGCSREEAFRRVHELYAHDDFNKVGPVLGSLDAISKLKEENELFVFTSRPSKVMVETKKWLDEHFPNMFKAVHTTSQYSIHNVKRDLKLTKSVLCMRNGVEIMIEDAAHYANDCAQAGIKVLIFSKPWNENEKLHPTIKRIDGWQDVLKEIRNL